MKSDPLDNEASPYRDVFLWNMSICSPYRRIPLEDCSPYWGFTVPVSKHHLNQLQRIINRPPELRNAAWEFGSVTEMCMDSSFSAHLSTFENWPHIAVSLRALCVMWRNEVRTNLHEVIQSLLCCRWSRLAWGRSVTVIRTTPNSNQSELLVFQLVWQMRRMLLSGLVFPQLMASSISLQVLVEIFLPIRSFNFLYLPSHPSMYLPFPSSYANSPSSPTLLVLLRSYISDACSCGTWFFSTLSWLKQIFRPPFVILYIILLIILMIIKVQ